ncbi:MAG: RidA family protein, partial [Gemmatimonadales bacterium]
MARTRAPLVMMMILLGGCAANSPPASARFFPVPGNQPRPFSEAVQVGDMLYLSGQLGTDSTGRLVEGGVGPETRQALANIESVLARHGAA